MPINQTDPIHGGPMIVVVLGWHPSLPIKPLPSGNSTGPWKNHHVLPFIDHCSPKLGIVHHNLWFSFCEIREIPKFGVSIISPNPHLFFGLCILLTYGNYIKQWWAAENLGHPAGPACKFLGLRVISSSSYIWDWDCHAMGLNWASLWKPSTKWYLPLRIRVFRLKAQGTAV